MNIPYINSVGRQRVNGGKRMEGRSGAGSAGQYSSLDHSSYQIY